jgi:mannose-6-phosphate isomerase-like protein (cupin superfamily)
MSGRRSSGEILISCDENFDEILQYFVTKLKFKVESIYPADHPVVSTLIGHDLRLKLTLNQKRDMTQLNIYCDDIDEFVDLNPHPESKEPFLIEIPNGTQVLISFPETLTLPLLQESLVICHYSTSPENWNIGRAGMRYRDLIPDRLGGRYIASHIHIPRGGPVPDYVHYHQVRFQMIFCYRGRVKVVYEDQGEPFFLESGDCVIQPPEIRHRVLESSDDLHVIEIGCPAIHKTIADFDLTLPNQTVDHERLWNNQKFIRFVDAECDWKKTSDERLWNPSHEMSTINHLPTPLSLSAQWILKETGILQGTDGVADVVVLNSTNSSNSDDASEMLTSHNCEFFFLFVLIGQIEVRISDEVHLLGEGSSVTIPSHTPFLVRPSDQTSSSQSCSKLLRVSVR